MISRRTQWVMLIVAAVSTVVLSALWEDLAKRADLEASQASTTSQLASERARALTLLRAWDAQRAAAYATPDVRALKRLYAPGSVSGANDVDLLKRYVARGLRIEAMTTQILGVEILEHTKGRLVLSVTDRLASATAVKGEVRQELPRDEVNTRRISLRLLDERWVVDEVDADEGAQPRPVESTSRTAGS